MKWNKQKLGQMTVLGLALGLSQVAIAKDLTYNVIQLSDSAQMQVPQNQLNVNLAIDTLASNRQNASAQSTAKLNRVLNAIEQAGLKGQILNRSVYEEYDYSNQKRESRGWRDVVQLSVYSENTAKVNQLFAAVQNDARLESQSYGLTTQARRQYELQLTETAIRNFEQQAQTITQVLGAKRYRLVELNVGSVRSHSYAQPRMAMKANVQADALEVAQDLPGETEIQVSVSGKIQVQ